MTKAVNGQNDHRYDDATKFTKDLADKAAGAEALPLMAIHFVQQAAAGVFDTEPNKHGKGIDDAKHQFSIYADRISKKSVMDRTGDSVKSQTSKARQFIKMGMMTTCDGVQIIERAQKLWNAAHKADPKSVKAAYPAFTDVARLQQSFDVDLTDEQITSALLKADPKEQTVEKILEGVQKTLDALITGEKGLKDQDPLIVTARQNISDRLAAFALERETADDQAEIARLEAKGYKLTTTGESALHVAA